MEVRAVFDPLNGIDFGRMDLSLSTKEGVHEDSSSDTKL